MKEENCEKKSRSVVFRNVEKLDIYRYYANKIKLPLRNVTENKQPFKYHDLTNKEEINDVIGTQHSPYANQLFKKI